MLKIIKKIKCRLLFCCKSKCSINDDNYDDRTNENHIMQRIVMSTDL